MLVLSRRVGEELVIADNIRVRVVSVNGQRIKLGIVAPVDVTVYREEIFRLRKEFAEPPVGEPVPLICQG